MDPLKILMKGPSRLALLAIQVIEARQSGAPSRDPCQQRGAAHRGALQEARQRRQHAVRHGLEPRGRAKSVLTAWRRCARGSAPACRPARRSPALSGRRPGPLEAQWPCHVSHGLGLCCSGGRRGRRRRSTALGGGGRGGSPVASRQDQRPIVLPLSRLPTRMLPPRSKVPSRKHQLEHLEKRQGTELLQLPPLRHRALPPKQRLSDSFGAHCKQQTSATARSGHNEAAT